MIAKRKRVKHANTQRTNAAPRKVRPKMKELDRTALEQPAGGGLAFSCRCGYARRVENSGARQFHLVALR